MSIFHVLSRRTSAWRRRLLRVEVLEDRLVLSATHLVFMQQPGTAMAGDSVPPAGTVVAGEAFSPAVTVAVEDASNQVVTSDSSQITLSFGYNAGSANLVGQTTVPAVNGIATFSNVSVDKSGYGYTLVASDSTLQGATSKSFDVPPAVASVVGGILTVTGGSDNDFVSIRLSPTSVNTTQVDYGPDFYSFSNSTFTSIAVNLGAGNDTLFFDNNNGNPIPSGGVTYDGGTGSNTLFGPTTLYVPALDHWNITAANAGVLNSNVLFTNTESLEGGNDGNVFQFGPMGSLAGTLNGNGGFYSFPYINTLDYSTYAGHVTFSLGKNASTAINSAAGNSVFNIQTVLGSAAGNNLLVGPNPSSGTLWNITAANAGNLYNANNTGTFYTFSNFQNLAGGSSNDTFKFAAGASLSGYVDGGAGINKLDYSGYSSRVVVSLAANAATGIKNLSGSGIADFQTIVGSSNTTNLIVGTNSDSTWNITGPNAGTLSPSAYGTISFSAFANLTGGTGKDTFALKNGASVSGAIDGRITGGSNTLDYSGYGARVVVSLANSSATGIKNGSGSSVYDFQNIIGSTSGNVAGSGGNLLVGPSTGVTWGITAANAGQLGTIPITFSSFPNLTGSLGNDDFIFSDGVTLLGSIDGGNGVNTLDYSAWSTGITINLKTGSANNLAKVYDISNVFGGSGNDTITGGTLGGILLGGAGEDVIIGGAGRSVIIGGLGNDTIQGGANDDLLIAGTTSYDINLNALLAILAEWQSSLAYASRVSDLRNGTGLSAGNKLLLGTTVLDDSGKNLLTGDSSTPLVGELDWFFANTAVGHDTIFDLQTGELVN